MNKVLLVIRILFGVLLLVFGLNKFLGFLEMPMPEGTAGTYLAGLAASGYTFKLIATVEVLTGLALLTNKFLPLALVIMAPVSVNILLFHLILDPPGLPLGGAVFVLNAFLLLAHKKSYQPLLRA